MSTSVLVTTARLTAILAGEQTRFDDDDRGLRALDDLFHRFARGVDGREPELAQTGLLHKADALVFAEVDGQNDAVGRGRRAGTFVDAKTAEAFVTGFLNVFLIHAPRGWCGVRTLITVKRPRPHSLHGFFRRWSIAVAYRWRACLAAVVLMAHCSCERRANEELPDLRAREYPPATEYFVLVREPGKLERTDRKPFQGSESILDAISPLHQEYGGLAAFNVWLIRRGDAGNEQVLKVDWVGITQRGEMGTNFLLCGGDRLILEGRHPPK